MATGLSNTQREIFWALPASGTSWMRLRDAANAAKISPTTVSARLSELLAMGYVVRQFGKNWWEYQRAPMDFGPDPVVPR